MRLSLYTFLHESIKLKFATRLQLSPLNTINPYNLSTYMILYPNLSLIMISAMFPWRPGGITCIFDHNIARAVKQNHVQPTPSRLAPGREASKRLEISPFIGILSGSLSFIPPSLSALPFASVSDFLTSLQLPLSETDRRALQRAGRFSRSCSHADAPCAFFVSCFNSLHYFNQYLTPVFRNHGGLRRDIRGGLLR